MLSCDPGVCRIVFILSLFLVLNMVHSTSSYVNENDFFQFGENGTFKCDYFCDSSNNNDQSYFPPYFTDKCSPPDVLPIYISPEGESGVEVFWTEPVAVDKSGVVPRIEQVAGDKNGSYFNGSAEGRIFDIVYVATNEDGLKDSCHFQFKVYDKSNCTTPVEIENGYYVCTNGTMPGSVCSYKCNEGYNVTGKTDVTCQSDNHKFPVWSAAPTCEVIHCMAPIIPKNGIISCNDSTYSYNSICTITCDEEYTANGPLYSYTICQADSLWSRPTICTNASPTCPTNFIYPLYGSLLYQGSDTFKLKCHPFFDFQYKFPGDIRCIEGEWTSNIIPGCNGLMKPYLGNNFEINFYGQGCSQNAMKDFLKYNTFEQDFEEYSRLICQWRFRVSNFRIECIPTLSDRVRKDIWEVQADSNSLNDAKVPFHDVFKRSASESFMISFTIRYEFDDEIVLAKISKDIRNWVVGYSLQILQDNNYTMDHFRTINQTVQRCGDDHIQEGPLCRTCSVGYFYNETSDRCEMCSVGTFKDKSGLTSCLFCPEGTLTKGKGSVSMAECKELCRPGSFSPDGLMTCALCPKGFYQDEFRQTECKKCPNGTTTVLANSSDIEQCNVSGGWTEWSGWSECSVSCDQGIQQRTRQCKNPSPSEYGDSCHGQTSQNKECVRNECKACPKLKETNSSYHECSIDRDTGLETCSVRCKDGYVNGYWPDAFRHPRCGMQTGFYWLPANVTFHCSVPTMPQSFLLNTSIEYEDLIPIKHHDKAKNSIRAKLLNTKCFNSDTCEVNLSFDEVYTINVMDDVSNRSKLYLELRRTIVMYEITNNTKEVKGETDFSLEEWKNAIVDMESTAEYMKNFTSDVFDIYVDPDSHLSRRRRSLKYTAEKTSISINGHVNCENGQLASNGMCIECPPGTYTIFGRCKHCTKGTYQPESGQKSCSICPPGLTTYSFGAYRSAECSENKEGKEVHVQNRTGCIMRTEIKVKNNFLFKKQKL